jgi:predicted PurR-regulated permease PerM
MLVMAALGVLSGLGLWVVGLELALVIGVLAGLLSIVPYLGTIVGVCAGLIAAWFQFHDVWVLIQVGLVFGAGQMIEGFVLTPRLVGERIGLHPVAVIFAVLAGAQLFGFVGVLLALPVAAILKVLLDFGVQHYKNSSLYERERLVDDGLS